MRNFKSVITFILFIIILLILWFLIQNNYATNKSLNEQKLRLIGEKTYCTVIETGNMKGAYVIVEYVNNKKTSNIKEYTYYSSTEYIPIGEKYLIYYDKHNPLNYFIDFSEPFFLDSEKTDSVEGIIKKITDQNVVMYEYNVAGKEYKTFKKMPENYQTNERSKCIIRYAIDTPERSAIIHSSRASN